MQRFVFSMQTILDLRLKEEEKILLNLADKEMELQRGKEILEQLKKELEKYQKEQKSSRLSQNALSLRHSVSWRHSLKKDLLVKAQELQEIVADISYIRTQLLEATQKRKSLEILRDKQKEAWQKEFNRKEQIFLDELAQNQYRNKSNESTHI